MPFDLPFVDLYHRLLAGKDLIDRIFAAATGELRMKYYLHGFCAVQEKTNNLGHNEAGFRKALNHLQYAKKWFQKLRAVLYLEGQSEEDRDLAPLSKMYHLTTEEAEMIPLRLSGFLQSVTQELSCCKHPDRRAFLEKMQGQVKKYRPNLRLPTNSITIDGKESLLVPPRTNNCMETQFRYIKSLLRRCTGRSKLPKEFGSVGALLPYYLTMRAHPSFKAIFQNDQSLADEFARGSRQILDQHGPQADALLRWMFEVSLSRSPTSEETASALEMLGEKPTAESIADCLWAIVMLPEFQLIR